MDDLLIEMNSLWEAAAPGWDDQRLDGAVEANLAIIGAGITGLAAALRAAELGKSVVVVDAARPGWGASGRNGGQVIPGLKLDPDEIVERFDAPNAAIAPDPIRRRRVPTACSSWWRHRPSGATHSKSQGVPPQAKLRRPVASLRVLPDAPTSRGDARLATGRRSLVKPTPLGRKVL